MDRDRPIEVLAARQHGVFSRSQAVSLGLSEDAADRRLRSGRWRAVEPGIYAMAGSPDTWERRLVSAVLVSRGRALVSHVTAAALHELSEVRSEVTHVTVVHGRHHPRSAEREVHQARNLTPRDATSLRGIAVTSIPRTLVDVAGCVSRERLEAILDAALVGRKASLRRLRAYVEQTGNKRGVGYLRRLLAEREDGVPESELERRFIRLVRKLRLPEPARQVRIGSYRVDFAYPAHRIAIELDGYRYHGSSRALRADLVRQNRLVLLGWLPLRFTWADVADEDAVAETLRTILARETSVAESITRASRG